MNDDPIWPDDPEEGGWFGGYKAPLDTPLLDDVVRYLTPPDERPLARVLPFRPKEEPKR